MATTVASDVSAVNQDRLNFQTQLLRVFEALSQRANDLSTLPTTSNPDTIQSALRILPQNLPILGLGLAATTSLLLDQVCPALSGGQAGPRFFGLVTGGVTPSAVLADFLVTSYDPCVQVHLPEETISTAIEHQALLMLLELLSLSPTRFSSNTFTTGATASNLLGLTLGREYTVSKVKERNGFTAWSVSENGFGGIEVDVFCAGAHASVAKAASIAGIGRANTSEILSSNLEEPCAFDLEVLEKRLLENVGKRGSIVVSSFGEVNTGGFTPNSAELRKLCDQYDAWLHCDAAFGAFAGLHPDFAQVSEELALADSITLDAHKWLNVPYDCGIFFSRDPSLLRSVCGPGQASIPYLSSASSTRSDHPLIDSYRQLPPPLFVNVENSRRFRALPVYASLICLGKSGYAEIFQRNVEFARRVETWMREGGGRKGYDVLLPQGGSNFKTMNIVLFAPSSSAPERYQGPQGSVALGKAINQSKECYVTPSRWRGRGALRLAVSNWATSLDDDYLIVIKVLEGAMQQS